MKVVVLIAAVCGLWPSVSLAEFAPFVPIENSQTVRYSIEAWPRGETEPLRFISGLYLEDSVSFVRLDDSRLDPDPARTRRTTDFDSLRAARYVPRGLGIATAPEWYKASVAGRRWAFPVLSGKVTLYSAAPGRAVYAFMDTGAGIEPYQEAVVRTKIAKEPSAARLLRQEKNGHTVAWGMAWVGGGLAVGGFVSNLAGFEPGASSVVTLIGIGVAAASWVPHLGVQGNYEEAIRAYNQAVVK
jgi:hypothetical protein